MWDQRPKDYWGDARKNPTGDGWLGVYRVPWKAKPVYLHGPGQKPAIFRSRADALKAVMNHTHNLMCPYITSMDRQAIGHARARAESLFSKGGASG